jgi:Skp family chaperone for outer membrane proteins
MKWFRLSVWAITFAMAGATVSTLMAQRAAAPEWTRTGTVLVDVAKLTLDSARLTQSVDALKKQYEASGEALKKEGERGQQLTEQALKLPANSPERKRIEQQLMKMRADFELHGQQVTNDTKDREAQLYFGFSREMQAELHRFAQANGIKLILRSDPSPPDMNDPRMILHEIQKFIVYQRGLEVTPVVHEAMHRRTGTSTATTRPAAPAPPRGPIQQ